MCVKPAIVAPISRMVLGWQHWILHTARPERGGKKRKMGIWNASGRSRRRDKQGRRADSREAGVHDVAFAEEALAHLPDHEREDRAAGLCLCRVLDGHAAVGGSVGGSARKYLVLGVLHADDSETTYRPFLVQIEIHL